MSQPESAEITEQDNTAGRRSGQLIGFSDYEIDQLRTNTFLAEKSSNRELLKISETLNLLHILCLFPHWVVAFAFRTRAWAEIDESDDARKTGFKELVIPPKYRKLLVSLVETHTSDTRVKSDLSKSDSTEEPVRQIDLVRGKGLGLMILLHGPPGSGKTSTAETIAAYTGRPLYTLTCGDLGLEPDDVEKSLESHTRRADKWGCVLLLDEADVFLMKREWRDIKRNALVAVFLRQLEYYAGILFLTTNRVGVLDEAFKSRIHIALRYPKIEQKQTIKIWKNILDRLQRDNENREIKIEFDRQDMLDYAETQFEKHKETESTWNGRQIRNVFQTAITLGQYERSMRLLEKGLTSEEAISTGKKRWKRLKLTTKSFDIIAETAQEFEDYLYAVHGDRDLNLALEDQLRDDRYDTRISAAPLRMDNSSFSVGSSRNTLSSSIPQRPRSGVRSVVAGTGVARSQSTRITPPSTDKMSLEDSEDSTGDDNVRKRTRRTRKTRSSDSSNSESD
ncbi:P-loop containing nucleoside triphosphate hydrolase protein [Whalleya microplaca]|nr:P-loop containing nucleoside triphosphate hydrolase protein [Whalleya microplaca]